MPELNSTNYCNTHDALVSYMYNEANPEESAGVELHLKTCASCRAELDSFHRIREMLGEWKVEDLPMTRLVVDQPGPHRESVAVFKEMFRLMPIWSKVLGAAACILLLLSLAGIEISVAGDGVTVRMNGLRSVRQVPIENEIPGIAETRVEELINRILAVSEQKQREELAAELARLKDSVLDLHQSDLATLKSRLREQRTRLNLLEQDLDHREGLTLTDFLFGEITGEPAEPSEPGATSDGD